MSTRLSDNERQLLAREVAADQRKRSTHRQYEVKCKDCDTVNWSIEAVTDDRAIFLEGWDAAMEYVAKKLAEGVEHLDET